MNTCKRKYAVPAAALAAIVTAILLGTTVTLGRWYSILVMVAAAIWFATVAFHDRPLTADEGQIRARLRKAKP